MLGLIGKTIGRYRITEHLGRGGMAEVYKAYQPSLDRYVAIKVMHSFLADDKDFLTRFEREAKVVATLRHPNIVQVHDFDVAEGMYYMVMEYIDGATLKAMLEQMQERGEWMGLDDAVRIILSVGSALRYAHERKMVHRDIKPANVMITSDGHVILTDFGIAKIMSTTGMTASGAMVGTPSYMSPEQGMGEPGDERSDIYALSVMLYQLAVGRLPYDADTPLAVVLKHINDPLPLPRALKPDLPEAIERVILKGLAKSRDDRFQTVEDLMTDLRAATGLPPDITPTESMKGGSAIKLSGATVVGRIGAATPRPAASPTSTVARLGGEATVARSSAGAVAAPGGQAESVTTTPLPAVAGRPKWLIPVVLVALLVLGGGGVALVALGNPPATPTPTPTLTLTPTIALTPTPTEFVLPEGTLNRDGVEFRSGPSRDAVQLATVGKDIGEFTVRARSADSQWLKIEFADGTTGWVPADAVDMGGVAVSVIPIAVTLPTPTQVPTNTPTPTETPSPTPPPTATFTPGPTKPPVTRAPTQPPQPTAPPASPTSAGVAPVDFGWERLNDGIRSGTDWVETVRIDPRGGDGNYVVFYLDQQVSPDPSGQYYVTIRSRGNKDGTGCKGLPMSVRVGSAGQQIEKALFFDPPPGCDGWWP